MADRLRRFVIPLFVDGTLAGTTDQVEAKLPSGMKAKITAVEVAFRNTGSAAGPTTVDVMKNGTTILTTPVSVAQGSAKTPVFGVLAAPTGEPSGVDITDADALRVDLGTISTNAAGLAVRLHCVAKDI